MKPTAVQRRIEGALSKSTLNPRQAQFMRLYADPSSSTFGNAYQSALAAGYAESYASNLRGLLSEQRAEAFAEVLEAAGVTDRALAEAHKALLTCGDVAGVHAGVKLGYQVKRHLPTASSRVEELLKEIGASQEEAKRSVDLVKRTPKDPHEIMRVFEKYAEWYRRTFPNGREEPQGQNQGGA